MDNPAQQNQNKQGGAHALLDRLRSLTEAFAARYGDPLKLSWSVDAMQRIHASLRHQLRALEIVARQIILTLAAQFDVAPAKPQPRAMLPRKKRSPFARGYFVPDCSPQHWRVQFSVFESKSAGNRPKREMSLDEWVTRDPAPKRVQQRFVDWNWMAQRYGRRFEAVLRVLKAPEAFAKRAAQVLARRERREAERVAAPKREQAIQDLIREDRRTPPIEDYAYYVARLKQKPPD